MSVLGVSAAALACDSPTSAADLTISTDSAAYTAIPVGYSQVVVKVRATFRNAGRTVATIPRCGSSVIYSVGLVYPANTEGAAYDAAWACAGSDPITVAAGETRTDTIVIHGPNSFDNTLQKYRGVLEGRFRLAYGGAESNEFQVRLPDGGVIPNVVRDLGAQIQTDSLLYHVRAIPFADGVLYDGHRSLIHVSISNPRPDTSYIVNCQGATAMYLERRDGDAWTRSWGALVPACLSQAIAIPPNGSVESQVDISGGSSGSRIGPQFGSGPVPGVYRLVWTQIVDAFTMIPTSFGTPIPIEHRRSNPFALVVEP